MGLSFLAPIFFAGMALIAAPFLIHRIRRPEREPLRFSSLLFIPDVNKEVIERRRIEHWLLMLLRMAVLAALALAFSRPYWRAMAAVDADDAPKRHMVLIDASYSMDRAGAFDEAKRAARRVIDGIAPGEPVGAIVFADRASVVAPLDDATDKRAGSKDAARDAINLAAISYGATDYVGALELAQQQLLDVGEESGARRSIVHLVTDSQRVGLPDRHSGWKLAPSIELAVVAVGAPAPRDFAITETTVRPAPEGAVRVLGKVRNWAETDAEDLDVKLVVRDEEIAAKKVSVKARSATQVAFELPASDKPATEGYLEVEAGGPRADDRRYFSYSPRRQGRIAILAASATPEERSGAWFFEQALPDEVKSPWRAQIVSQDALAGALSEAAVTPDVVIVTESAGLSAPAAESLLAYARAGGQLLIAAGGREELGALAPALDAAGITLGSLQYEKTQPSRFESLSWLDFNHSIFTPFQGTRYNDFSQVRFFNHLKVTAGESASVIARLDDDSPAVVECRLGEGRAIVWPFAVRLDWTNLPKTQRFVPMVFETLAYATDWEEIGSEFTVNALLPPAALPFGTDGKCEILLPGTTEARTIEGGDANLIRFDRPGLLHAREIGKAEWSQVWAVNVDEREGDPTRLEPDTLLARVATSAVLAENTAGAGIVGADVDARGYTIEEEYGRWALIAVCGLVLIECLYMIRLSRRRTVQSVTASQ